MRKDRLSLFLPFKGYRVLSKTLISWLRRSRTLPLVLTFLACFLGVMLSFFDGDGYEHVSISLLGIIGIHKGEATSIIWIVAAALEPHTTRMRRGRDVSSGPARAYGMPLRLISTT